MLYKLKKLIALLLAISCVLSCVGCGANTADPTQNSSDPTDGSAGIEHSESTAPSAFTNPGDDADASTDASNPSEPGGTQSSDPEDYTDPSNPSDETAPPATEPPATKPPVTEPPHEHSYSADVTVPTCTTAGYTTYTCGCGESYTDNHVAATGHTYTDEVVAPTTTAQGYTKHTCSCGDSYTDSYVDPIEEAFPYTEAELATAVIKYINQFRKEEGDPELIPQVGMGYVAQYRSVQLLTNYAHDIKDKREALAYYQYGKYIDMTVYGFDESYNYFEPDTQEAIGHFAAIKEPVDETAKHIALGFRNSPAHWSYLGDPENKYIGVGCSKDKYDWYICIMVSEITYG